MYHQYQQQHRGTGTHWHAWRVTGRPEQAQPAEERRIAWDGQAYTRHEWNEWWEELERQTIASAPQPGVTSGIRSARRADTAAQ